MLLNFSKSKEFSEYEYYIDGGFSGKDLNRPAIQKLIQDVKNHKIDIIIVFKLDRISRSQKDTLYLIEEVLNKMISMYLSGQNFNSIGKIVNMDERMVERRLLSITNTGVIPYKGEKYKGQHEVVVSKELYEEILRVNKLRSGLKYVKHYLLSGKVVCGHCGAKYRYQNGEKDSLCIAILSNQVEKDMLKILTVIIKDGILLKLNILY